MNVWWVLVYAPAKNFLIPLLKSLHMFHDGAAAAALGLSEDPEVLVMP